ncbi:MAG: hypothetical protein GY697_03110, partial [Desulfobacterales bacterium]|nr:hypothetical protein [Desulfobacterales bacterium]
YEHEPDFSNISPHYSRVLTLLIVHKVAKNFAAAEAPLTAAQLSHSHTIPIRLVRRILDSLVGSGILSRIPSSNNGGATYQPACDISYFSIKYVIDALDKNGVNSLPISQTHDLEAIEQSLAAFDEILNKSESNLLLKDI